MDVGELGGTPKNERRRAAHLVFCCLQSLIEFVSDMGAASIWLEFDESIFRDQDPF
jgi:hypothetical protein